MFIFALLVHELQMEIIFLNIFHRILQWNKLQIDERLRIVVDVAVYGSNIVYVYK